MTSARLIFTCWCAFGTMLAALSSGCADKKDPPKPVEKYAILPPKKVPEILKNTIFERVDLVDTEPLAVSGFGLMTRLQGTGDNTMIPTSVRNYMLNQMAKNG